MEKEVAAPPERGTAGNGITNASRNSISAHSSSSSDHSKLEKLDSKVVKVNAADDDPYRHLSEAEKAIIRRQVDIPEAKVTFWSLFRFATTNDKILMFLSGIAAIAAGAILPLMTVVFGSLTGVFQDYMLGQMEPDAFQHELNKFTL